MREVKKINVMEVKGSKRMRINQQSSVISTGASEGERSGGTCFPALFPRAPEPQE